MTRLLIILVEIPQALEISKILEIFIVLVKFMSEMKEIDIQ